MENITVQELHARREAGENIPLVDVREPAEHAEFNIGGVLLPLGRIREMDLDAIGQYRDQELVLYCRSGNRSGQAALVLESAGFTRVKNLVGGMLAWQEQGFPGAGG